MRILITGASGFVAGHLIEYISQVVSPVEISGLVRPGSCYSQTKKLTERIRVVEGDVRDLRSLLQVLTDFRPDRIFHLASLSSTDSSHNMACAFMDTNVMGTVNLLEALRELKLQPRVLVATSAEAYGLLYSDELPVKETAVFRPLSPFAVSKAAQDLLGFQYFKCYGLPIVRARIFSPVGPGQPPHYQISSLAWQIAEIEKKKREPLIKVANLENKRDYLDVRDLVRALWLILEKSEPGEVYNVGSGQAWSGHEILKLMQGLTRAKMVIETEDPKSRFPEPPILLADITRLVKLTGWKPQLNLKQSILDLLNYWRETA